MISLQDNFKVGDKVVYVPSYLKEKKYFTDEIEVGIISSWNDEFIHVRYGNDNTSKATRYEDLYFYDAYIAAVNLIK